MYISIIIASKNRPAQLDLLLRSLTKHFNTVNKVYVIYKYDNEYDEGYKLVFKRDYNLLIDYVKETDFNYVFLKILQVIKNTYVLFLADDCVVMRDIIIPSSSTISDDMIAFSLRLSDHIDYCLPADLKLPIPKWATENENVISWNWTECDKRGSYGYCMPFDSQIYNKDHIYNLIKDVQFDNPYQLECFMNTHRDSNKPMMASFKKSHIISISNNQLGQGGDNIAGNQTIEFLNKKWLDGYQIKLETFENIDVRQMHIILPYIFEKNNEI